MCVYVSAGYFRTRSCKETTDVYKPLPKIILIIKLELNVYLLKITIFLKDSTVTLTILYGVYDNAYVLWTYGDPPTLQRYT